MSQECYSRCNGKFDSTDASRIFCKKGCDDDSAEM